MASRREEPARADVPNLAPEVSQRISDFHRVKVRDGRKVWELTAIEAQYLEEKDTVVVTGPEVAFYGQDGQRVAIKGREGRIRLSGNEIEKIELGGGIEVRVGEYVVRTAEAVYVQDKDAILASGRVEIDGSELSLEGETMLVELGRQRVQVLKGVTSTLRGGGGGASAPIPGRAVSARPSGADAAAGRGEDAHGATAH